MPTEKNNALGIAAAVAPALSAGVFAASKIAGQSPNDMTIAMLIGMGLATLPGAAWTIYDATLSVDQKNETHMKRTRVLHATSNLLMTGAVVAMFMSMLPYVKEAHSVKVALAATPIFLNYAVINTVYNTLLRLGKISQNSLVELTSAGFGLVGSLIFLAAQALAFVEAKRKNDHVQMNAAAIAAIGVCGFVFATGHGAIQGVLAVKKECTENNTPSEQTGLINIS